LNFQLIPPLMFIVVNLTNCLFSIFEPSIAKCLLVLIFSWIFFGIPRCDPLLSLVVFPYRRIPWPRRRGFHIFNWRIWDNSLGLNDREELPLCNIRWSEVAHFLLSLHYRLE
jgi:hypothetical protein